MRRYVIKKLLLAIPVLLGITIIDYLLMSLAGNPLDMMTGPRVTQEAVAVRAEKLGLNQPVYMQYIHWLSEVLRGNLGYSFKSYQPVSEMIASHIGPTLLLMGVSLLAGLMIAVPAGIYSAVHRYQKRDFAVVTASFAGSSIPSFFLALILIDLFTVRLGWLPSSGMKTGHRRRSRHCASHGHAGAGAGRQSDHGYALCAGRSHDPILKEAGKR